MDRRITNAVDFIATLRTHDLVQVTMNGRRYNMEVSREMHRCDGAFGSYESNRVTVTFGPGGYAREVTAEQIANGTVEIERGHFAD